MEVKLEVKMEVKLEVKMEVKMEELWEQTEVKMEETWADPLPPCLEWDWWHLVQARTAPKGARGGCAVEDRLGAAARALKVEMKVLALWCSSSLR